MDNRTLFVVLLITYFLCSLLMVVFSFSSRRLPGSRALSIWLVLHIPGIILLSIRNYTNAFFAANILLASSVVFLAAGLFQFLEVKPRNLFFVFSLVLFSGLQFFFLYVIPLPYIRVMIFPVFIVLIGFYTMFACIKNRKKSGSPFLSVIIVILGINVVFFAIRAASFFFFPVQPILSHEQVGSLALILSDFTGIGITLGFIILQSQKLIMQGNEIEDRYRDTLDNMFEGVQIIGYDYRYIYANSSATNQGHTFKEDLIGHNIMEKFPGIEDLPMFKALTQCMEEREARQMKSEFSYPDGSKKYFNLSFQPVAAGVLIVSADITDRKSAEEANAKLGAIVESSDDAIFSHDLNWIILSWNSGAENLFGFRADDVIGKPTAILIPAELREEDELIRSRFLKGERIEHYETVRQAKDGRRIEVSLSISPIKDGKGVVTGAAKIIRDISGRKRVAEALRESEKRFRTIAETVPVLVCITRTEDGVVMFTNEFNNKAFGLRGEEIIGTQGPDYYCDPADRVKMFELFKQQGFVNNYEVKVKKSDGTPFWILTSVRPIVYDGHPAVIGASIDITENKKMEEKLRMINRRFYKILSDMPSGILLVTEENRIEYVNQVFCDMFGLDDSPKELLNLTADEMLEKVSAAYINPESALARIKEIVALGQALEGEDVGMRSGRIYLRYFIPIRLGENSSGRLWVHIDITERKRTEIALKESNEKANAILNATTESLWLMDLEGNILGANETAARRLGKTVRELTGKNAYDFLPLDVGERRKTKILEMAETGKPVQFEDEREGINFFHTFYPVFDQAGKTNGLVIFSMDITERKQAEDLLLKNAEELKKLNRALSAISHSSQALMRAEDEPDYLNDVCRVIIEDCGYMMAWIGFAEHDDGKKVRPAAQAGFEEGYLDTADITWADTERGRGPAGNAIRSGEITVCRNMLTDPDFIPWREEAIKRGYASSIALPLCNMNSVFGLVSIYSKDPDPFSEKEMQLLAELVDDLAFGIMSIRLRGAQLQAEEALKESEERFRAFMENSPGISWIKDREFRYLFLSRGSESLLGFKLEDVRGKTDSEIWPPEFVEMWRNNDQEVLNSGQSLQSVEEVVLPNGLHSFWLISKFRIDADGNNCVAGYGMDITRRRVAEKSLKESEERFRRMFEHNGAVMLLIESQSGAILDANNAAERFYGFSREQLRSMRIEDINQMSPDAVAGERENALKGIRNDFVFPHRIADGQIRWVEVYSTPIDIKGSKVLFSIIHDISERKIAEEERERLMAELDRRAAELDTLFNELPFLLSVHGPDGTYLRVNPALVNLFGVDPTKASRQSIAQRLNARFPDGQPLTSQNMPSSRALKGETVTNVEYLITDSQGKEHTLLMNAVPLKIDGNICGAVLSQADITERRKAEIELIRAKEEAEKAYQAKSMFIANISHELRTPLHSILGYNQMLKKSGGLTDKQMDNIEVMYNSGLHLLNMINDLLDLSKIEAGKMKLESKAFSLTGLLKKVIEIIYVQADEKNLEFIFETRSDIPANVIGDEKRLNQILLNLLSNAVKFTAEGRVILRIGMIENNRFRFEVEDTGVGIPQEQLDIIFDSFQQLEGGLSKSKGTGLGLTISRNLVKLMGSNLLVKSEPNKGSTFWFDIDFKLLNEEFEKIDSRTVREKSGNEVPEEIAVPSDEELRNLYGMAKNGDIIEIRKTILKIESEKPELTQFLSQLKLLTKKINLSGIQNLIRKYLKD